MTNSESRWPGPLHPVEGREPNRLIHATSPYLLQHAYNPVYWFPWGDEALAKASSEEKPIFLSIGYAACHWCHVMEGESFENEEIARILNDHYVPIKVDREERPDLDELYMTAVQLMTGQGGWPMTVVLTPELKPFFGGTYFPPDDRWGRPGLKRVLLALLDAWQSRREEVAQSADRVAEAIAETAVRPFAGEVPALEEALAGAADQMHGNLDAEWGGFTPAPKFPRSMGIELLMRAHRRFGHARHLDAATLTLDKMALGGMYDHVGGGFHRYSVDEKWLVPHFEKMLYDNALLAVTYTQGWQLTGSEFYRRVARETCNFVLRDLTDPQTGAFYSALDADSGGEEGLFYTWTPAEVREVLGEADAAEFSRLYDVTDAGNFEGRSIPHLKVPLEETHDPMQRARLAGLRDKLLAAREKRVHPLRDDKVLTSWNALMISALTQTGFALREQSFVDAAHRAASFLIDTMMQDALLLHAWRDGKAHVRGYLEDYAYLANALIDLYEASGELTWLERARELCEQIAAKFTDENGGGFFHTDGEDQSILVRTKECFDNATPAPNAVAAYALARLALYTGVGEFRNRAESALMAFGKALGRMPSAAPTLLFAYEELAGEIPELALVTPEGLSAAEPLLSVIRRRFLPGRLLAVLDTSDPGAAALAQKIPLLTQREALGGKATAYVCRGWTCRRPVTDPEELADQLEEPSTVEKAT